MKKILMTCALLFISGGVFADSADLITPVSGIVQFGQTAEFKADMQTVSGLPSGTNPDKTLIATVGVTGSGAYWLIGVDPNDPDALGNAPDQGWTMRSKSTPTKMVKVKVSDENRIDYKANLANLNWNRMSSDERAKIIINGEQDIASGDDYLLTVNVAKYIP